MSQQTNSELFEIIDQLRKDDEMFKPGDIVIITDGLHSPMFYIVASIDENGVCMLYGPDDPVGRPRTSCPSHLLQYAAQWVYVKNQNKSD